MSALAPSAFQITQAGLNAITIAASAEVTIAITHFAIGNGFNYTPSLSDTQLHGTIVFPLTPPAAYARLTPSSIDVVCVLPATAGPFLYGEIALYLSDGTLFALAVYSELQSKVTSLVNGIANSITFHAVLDLGIAASVVQIIVSQPGVATVIASTDFSAGPAVMPGTPSALIINERTWGNSDIFLTKMNDTQWNVHDFLFLGTSTITALSGDFKVLGSSAFASLEPDAPNGVYLVQDSKGNIRLVQSNSLGTVTLTYPMPPGTVEGVETISVYELGSYALRFVLNNTGDQVALTVPSDPVGSVVATNVQAAIEELDSAKVAKFVLLPDGSDLNTVVTSGFYRLGGSVVNGPVGAGLTVAAFGQLIVSRGLDSVSQSLVSLNSSRTFLRSGNSSDVGGQGVWGAWYELGYRTIPQNVKDSAYQLELSDVAKHIYHSSADASARDYVIPSNEILPFDIGSNVLIFNAFGAGQATISVIDDVLRRIPDGATGAFIIPTGGAAGILKVKPSEWALYSVGGTVLSQVAPPVIPDPPAPPATTYSWSPLNAYNGVSSVLSIQSSTPNAAVSFTIVVRGSGGLITRSGQTSLGVTDVNGNFGATTTASWGTNELTATVDLLVGGVVVANFVFVNKSLAPTASYSPLAVANGQASTLTLSGQQGSSTVRLNMAAQPSGTITNVFPGSTDATGNFSLVTEAAWGTDTSMSVLVSVDTATVGTFVFTRV